MRELELMADQLAQLQQVADALADENDRLKRLLSERDYYTETCQECGQERLLRLSDDYPI